jgi:regulatory protein
MSNSPRFGRDAKDFLRELGIDKSEPGAKEYGIRITAIAPCGSEKKTVRVLVSNPSGRETVEFALMNVHVESLSLQIGEIEEELLPELEYFAEVAKAYNSACSSFAFAPSSYSALTKKLLQKGFAKDVSADAIECLKQTDFVREDEIALRRAQIFVGKRWGRTRIIMKLREEGFGDVAMQSAKDFLDETDFSEICAEHVRKKYGRAPDNEHDRKLMYASLSRMGYSSLDIKQALKKL